MIAIRSNVYTSADLGVIERPVYAIVKETINQEYTARIQIVADNNETGTDGTTPIWQLLTTDRVLMVEGDLFDVVRVERKRDASGGVYVSVEAEHISYRLHERQYEGITTFLNQNVRTIFEDILDGVPGLEAGSLPSNPSIEFQLKDMTGKRALRLLAEFNGWELQYGDTIGASKRAIHMVTRRGSANGASIAAGTNVAGFTEVYDRREDEERRIMGRFTVAELSRAVGDFSAYAFALGDTVQVYDPALGINEYQRIVTYETDLANPEQSNIEIANNLETLAYDFQDVSDTQDDHENRLDDIEEALDELDDISTTRPGVVRVYNTTTTTMPRFTIVAKVGERDDAIEVDYTDECKVPLGETTASIGPGEYGHVDTLGYENPEAVNVSGETIEAGTPVTAVCNSDGSGLPGIVPADGGVVVGVVDTDIPDSGTGTLTLDGLDPGDISTGEGITARGNIGLYKVITARYWRNVGTENAPNFILVPVGSGEFLITDSLEPTWDYLRAVDPTE